MFAAIKNMVDIFPTAIKTYTEIDAVHNAMSSALKETILVEPLVL